MKPDPLAVARDAVDRNAVLPGRWPVIAWHLSQRIWRWPAGWDDGRALVRLGWVRGDAGASQEAVSRFVWAASADRLLVVRAVARGYGVEKRWDYYLRSGVDDDQAAWLRAVAVWDPRSVLAALRKPRRCPHCGHDRLLLVCAGCGAVIGRLDDDAEGSD